MTDIECILPDEVCPMWGKAVELVRARFEAESYGCIISHEELKAVMGMQPPRTMMEMKKEEFDYLIMTKVIDTLLEDYNLCLSSVQSRGYEISHPKDQIRKEADRYIRKSQKALLRAMSRLVNVDSELLDIESQQIQHDKISRIAFIKSAFRKRQICKPEKKKQIE